MKIKTRELTGAALDWVVTKLEAERRVFTVYPEYITNYSTEWAKGGPIIEREAIALDQFRSCGQVGEWIAAVITPDIEFDGIKRTEECGPTPLIAAMRCYVSSKLGDTIDVPEELTNP